MFPQSNNQQTFHVETGVPHFERQLASMGGAYRSNENLQLSKVALTTPQPRS